MKIYVDSYPHGLMKGHLIKLLEYFPEDVGRGTRITMFENLTVGSTWESKIRGVGMSRNKEEFSEPVIGRVRSINQSEGIQNAYDIEIEEGIISPDHVFVKAGQKQKGQDIIKQIFQNEISNYVKICDPYVGPKTLQLLKNVQLGVDILILTNKIDDESNFSQELKNSIKSQNIKVRKISNTLHARYILTQSAGWSVDHSLKNFGEKDAYLTRLESSVDHESNFDSRWIQAIEFTV
ncbi:MAG: hypothetical protein IIC67_01875 [Thaumarchaeota archaeon]|nr:hypothetical protein [Nitrososphaerota archaeon]